MRIIQAKFLGLVRNEIMFLTDDGILLPWYSGHCPDYLVPQTRYTVATDGRAIYPATII